MHTAVLKTSVDIIQKFKIEEVTGLNINDAVVLLHDLMDIQAANIVNRNKFAESKKRALLLPHCSRAYLDNRCKAFFDANIPSYICAHCSENCLVNQADKIAKEKGYDVFVLSGGSCVPKILNNAKYDGVVGVACGEEVKMLHPLLNNLDIAVQSIPLIKNGCVNTVFNIETLIKVL
ncbi:MAG: DUF116 domain-containing protein [Candidatus Bathyarchaeota archaeon]|nr:DUF116 domain-containing protein [Candidatus Termiticorpusculum sp.]MCL2867908.1 DUF116 domain-containing protein [Candidatus Termiticorpusculum sp.]